MSFEDDLRRFGPDSRAPLSLERRPWRYCARLTAAHYENFSVVTWLTPREHRPAFQSIYAFCRWSDDLGDEVGDPGALARAARLVARRAAGHVRGRGPASRHDRARGDRRRHAIPIEPFEALIDAFVQDQTVTEYATYDQLARLLHAFGQPGGPSGPLRGRCVQRRERPALRRDLHRASTGQLLAGRGPRPGDRPDLPAARGPRSGSATPTPTCGHFGSPRPSPT